MNGLFEDVQRLIPPGGTPRRVLYQGPPGSPTGTLYKAVGEVEVVRNPPTAVKPGEGSRPGSTGKESESQPVPDTGSLPNSGLATQPQERDGFRQGEGQGTRGFSVGVPDVGRSPRNLQGPIHLRAGTSRTLWSSGTTNRRPLGPNPDLSLDSGCPNPCQPDT